MKSRILLISLLGAALAATWASGCAATPDSSDDESSDEQELSVDYCAGDAKEPALLHTIEGEGEITSVATGDTRIYFAVSHTDPNAPPRVTIHRIPKAGGAVETIAEEVGELGSMLWVKLALDRGNIYWTRTDWSHPSKRTELKRRAKNDPKIVKLGESTEQFGLLRADRGGVVVSACEGSPARLEWWSAEGGPPRTILPSGTLGGSIYWTTFLRDKDTLYVGGIGPGTGGPGPAHVERAHFVELRNGTEVQEVHGENDGQMADVAYDDSYVYWLENLAQKVYRIPRSGDGETEMFIRPAELVAYPACQGIDGGCQLIGLEARGKDVFITVNDYAQNALVLHRPSAGGPLTTVATFSNVYLGGPDGFASDRGCLYSVSTTTIHRIKKP